MLNQKIQKFYALFLGLCEKVENRDMTTAGQFIFEQTRVRLFSE